MLNTLFILELIIQHRKLYSSTQPSKYTTKQNISIGFIHIYQTQPSVIFMENNAENIILRWDIRETYLVFK